MIKYYTYLFHRIIMTVFINFILFNNKFQGFS